MPRASYFQRRLTGFGMAAKLFAEASRVGIPHALSMEVEEIGRLVAERSKSYLGHTQTSGHGGYPPWAPLAPATLRHKAADTPLLETGELEADIHYEVRSPLSVEIGTNVPYGRYLELGTVHMPPRPFLRPAAVEILTERREAIGSAVVRGILGAR